MGQMRLPTRLAVCMFYIIYFMYIFRYVARQALFLYLSVCFVYVAAILMSPGLLGVTLSTSEGLSAARQ